VREISAVGGIPNLVMVEPCCPEEVAPLFDWCLDSHNGPSFLRLVSVPYRTAARLPEDYRPALGRGVSLRDGRDATIITAGLVMVAEALEAAERLAASGVSVGVVNLPWLNRIDMTWLAALASRTPVLVTLDNHFRAGGQGEKVLAALAQANLRSMPRSLAIGLEAVPPSGRNDEVLAALGLDAKGIAERVSGFLNEIAVG
jgi:transketolase